MPKTIDNDVVPIKQSLGLDGHGGGRQVFCQRRQRAVRQSSHVNYSRVHGARLWLLDRCHGQSYMDSPTAYLYSGLNLTKQRKCLHAVYVPEVRIDVDAEARRLKRVMDTHHRVNIFLSEGAGVHDIVAQLEARGESVPRDAFGHVKLDKVQPGKRASSSSRRSSVRSRRPVVLRRLHAIDATRVHQTRSWVVSFSVLSELDRVRETRWLRAGAEKVLVQKSATWRERRPPMLLIAR